MTATDREVRSASKRSLLSGIVSAAADNDPTTVGTLAIAGAAVAYRLEWVLLVVVPMFVVVQAIGTQVATVARKGLQLAIRRRYGMKLAALSMFCILAVNLVTYAADLSAGGAALELITNVAARWWIVPISIAVALLLAFGTVEKVRGLLAILPLAFLAYIASALLAHPNWSAVAHGLIPHISGGGQDVAIVIALIGTTLTVYSYYWQTIEIAQDAPPRRALGLIQLSTLPGTLLTGIVLWFIFIGTAATLGVGHHSVHSAQDAARALEPAAGRWAGLVFGVGLLGSALLALPVIAAGTGYAIASTFGWHGSIDLKPGQAKWYYAVIFAGIGLATAVALLPIQAMTLLFTASIAAGFATPITLAMLVALGRDRATMGSKRIAPPLAWAGWTVAAIVTIAAVAFIRWH